MIVGFGIGSLPKRAPLRRRGPFPEVPANTRGSSEVEVGAKEAVEGEALFESRFRAFSDD